MLSWVVAFTQPSNDECNTPIVLSDVTSFCSSVGAFSNNGATPSTYGPAGCFTPAAQTQNDVWFSFVAGATDVSITVRGATSPSAGGTLINPQVALYYGACGGTINELECQSGANANIAEAYQGGLFVGSTYLIRIQGGNGNNGTFQLCVNNYNPPVDPKSDCPQAAILCDKSSFGVQSVTGAGADITELSDADCFNNGIPGNYESNSTWFVWTCSVSGPLTFTLTPNNGPDDLDFVLYRLPNGIGNCQGRIVERCMASGASDTRDYSACVGPTGLRVGDPDISEDAGCENNGDNAWLAPLDMVAGVTYALCVNNFSAEGNGFDVEFGGSGEFLGPDAKFKTIPDAVCLGTQITVEDQSTFSLGTITGWEWSFGADVQPQTAGTQGPHNVTFTTPGIHPVVLRIKTDLGCKVTAIQNVTVFPDVEVDTIIAAPDCNGGSNGVITIDNIRSGTPAYQFSWNNGPFTSNNTLSGLVVGTYSLAIVDANDCRTDLEIDVRELELAVAPDITPPLCTGDTNGFITLNVTNGTGPYQFDWGNGFIPSNTQGGYTAGVYNILGLDAELCKGNFTVTITDHPPVALEMDTVDITCYQINDGVGIAIPSGGVGNFTFQWSDNQIGKEAENLPPGNYAVTVSDGNGCSITGAVSIKEPPELNIDLIRTFDLLCNGLPTGEIEVIGSGGRPAYEYSTNGRGYYPTGLLVNLFAGDYWVKVRDQSGCIDSVNAVLNQPLPVTLLALPMDTLVDLGNLVQTSTVTGPAGRPMTFAWTPADGLSCTACPEPLISTFGDQLYTVKITDVDGCVDSTQVRIRVNRLRPVYFPNIFDPEKGTLPNNFFTGFSGPAGAGINLLRVYDRWGDLVFEGKNIPLNDPVKGWDGMVRNKPATPGVYTWYALIGFVDGVELQYDGNVTLVR